MSRHNRILSLVILAVDQVLADGKLSEHCFVNGVLSLPRSSARISMFFVSVGGRVGNL